MKTLKRKSTIQVKKYRSYRSQQGKTFANVLARNSKAEAPNRKWATDVTEFNVKG